MSKQITRILQGVFLSIALIAIAQEDSTAAFVAVICTMFSLLAEFIKDIEP